MIGVLRLPAEIRLGFGARRSAPAVVCALGRRVLVVADPALVESEGFAELVRGLREACAAVSIVDEVPPELPVGVVEETAREVAGFGADVVLGYGGGSALDAAKLIAVLLAHGGRLSDYYGENAVPGPIIPLVAVPTTAGTGSEATPVAVVSDPDRALKVGVSSPHLVPRAAIIDPELTISAPRGVTACSGIDAFVHAVESYTASDLGTDPSGSLPVFVGRNLLSDPLSLEAAGLIYRALPAAVADPTDRRARFDMARGSLLAGMAFGSTGTHLSHAIQYPVGAMTHTPHGMGTGVLLPYVLQACLPAIADRLVDIGLVIGVLSEQPDEDGRERAAQRVVDAVAGLVADAGLPDRLEALGVDETDAERIVALTLEVSRLVAISPLGADRRLLERIIGAAVTGDRGALATPAAP